ncbi:MAG: hypothetical protein HY595_04035 [Candidatus Omnitrophica bacterium]|nr:hypothetical protein [Candidatus Omnitrophota bacterium]
MSRQRGLVLGLVVVTAVVFAAISYAALFWALHLARLSGAVDVRLLQARFAAEGGIAWAMQQLAYNPAWSSGVGTDLTLNGIHVDVVIPACAATPCLPRKLEAKVSY